MNPVTKALQELSFRIPRGILEKTFLSNLQPFSLQPTSLDARIREKVIEPRVMVDCNLMGGTEAAIPLASVPKQQIDTFTYVYRIPKRLTQGRTITRAISISYGQTGILGTSSNIPLQGTSPVLDAASGLLMSHAPIPTVSTAQCHVIGENTVMVIDTTAIPQDIFLRCWLENDTAFNHLQPTSYKDFSKLVELATKSYIYNQLILPMDRAFLHSGFELGQFKSVVESYSDAEENYQTFLNEVWRKVAVLNDFHGKRRHISLVTGGNW